MTQEPFDSHEESPEEIIASEALIIFKSLSRSVIAVPEFEPFYEELAPYIRRELLKVELKTTERAVLEQDRYRLIKEIQAVSELITHRKERRRRNP